MMLRHVSVGRNADVDRKVFFKRPYHVEALFKFAYSQWTERVKNESRAYQLLAKLSYINF